MRVTLPPCPPSGQLLRVSGIRVGSDIVHYRGKLLRPGAQVDLPLGAVILHNRAVAEHPGMVEVTVYQVHPRGLRPMWKDVSNEQIWFFRAKIPVETLLART